MVLADEHLKNPDFNQGLANWSVYLHSSMRSSVKRHVDNGVLTVQVDSAASSPTHVQLMQKVTTLKNNQQYILSFDARRDGKQVKTQVVCSQQGKPFKDYGLNQAITFSDAWSYHELPFTTKGLVDKNSPCIRLYLGNQVGTVELRNFSLIEKPKDQTPTDQGPVIMTILGTGLKKEYFNPSNETIQKAARDFADAGFTMTWAASPATWVKHGLHNNAAFYAHFQKLPRRCKNITLVSPLVFTGIMSCQATPKTTQRCTAKNWIPKPANLRCSMRMRSPWHRLGKNPTCNELVPIGPVLLTA